MAESGIPVQLKPVVKALRRAFRAANHEFASATSLACYSAIHSKESENKSVFWASMVELFASTNSITHVKFQALVETRRLPDGVRAFQILFLEGIASQARVIFDRLLKVARAQKALLSEDPIVWTQRRIRAMVKANAGEMAYWALRACDGPQPSANIATWLAPGYLLMKPMGPYKYEEDRLHVRLMEAPSIAFLLLLEGQYYAHLKQVLFVAARDAMLEALGGSVATRQDVKSGENETGDTSKRSASAPDRIEALEPSRMPPGPQREDAVLRRYMTLRAGRGGSLSERAFADEYADEFDLSPATVRADIGKAKLRAQGAFKPTSHPVSLVEIAK